MFVNAEGGISSVSPAVLMENAHILTKGRLYEYVMEKTIEECDNKKDISKIEAIDAFMKGFIVSERYLHMCM
jgi:flagellin-specific chaperone FliS